LGRWAVPHQWRLYGARADEALVPWRRVGGGLGRWGEGNSAGPGLGDSISVGVGWDGVRVLALAVQIVVIRNTEAVAAGRAAQWGVEPTAVVW